MHIVSSWQILMGLSLAVILGWIIGYFIRVRQFRKVFGFPLPRRSNRHLFKAQVDAVIVELGRNYAAKRLLAEQADMGGCPYFEVSRLMEERYATERRLDMAKELAKRFGFAQLQS